MATSWLRNIPRAKAPGSLTAGLVNDALAIIAACENLKLVGDKVDALGLFALVAGADFHYPTGPTEAMRDVDAVFASGTLNKAGADGELQPAELQDLFARAWEGAAKRGYDEVLARSFS